MVSHVINALARSRFGAVLFEMARTRYVPYPAAGEVWLLDTGLRRYVGPIERLERQNPEKAF